MAQVDAGNSITARSAIKLRDEGPATVTDLARALDLSRTSIESAIAALSERGLVEEVTAEEVTADESKRVGRPARRYALAADRGAVVGVDIGISHVRAVVTDLGGSVCIVKELPGLAPGDGAARLAAVLDVIRESAEDAGFAIEQVRALGLSLPGLIGSDGRLIASSVVPEWSGVDVGGHLRDRLDCPVAVDNEARLAAVAEHHLGAGQLVDDMLFISVGRRISMGLILGGRARRGVHNAAGEVGHLAFGEVEDTTGNLTWRNGDSAEEVFSRARDGDAGAADEIDAFVRVLARGVAGLALSVDPAIVVVGGGLSQAGESLIAPLSDEIHRILRLPIELPIVAARLGARASAYGALVHAFSRHPRAIYGLASIPTPRIPVSA